LTFSYLARIPQRETIRRRLTALWNSPRYQRAVPEGGTLLLSQNDGLQNHAVLYDSRRTLQDSWRASRACCSTRTLFRPTARWRSRASPCPRTVVWLAYGTSASGSDWTELHVREVATGRDLPDRLQWVKFSG